MIVDARVESVINIDIESDEAFRILCQTLDMEFVLNEDIDFFVREDEYGDNCVYRIYRGCDDVRDQYMIDHSDKLFAIWDGIKAGGVYSTIRKAQKKNIDVIYYPKDNL